MHQLAKPTCLVLNAQYITPVKHEIKYKHILQLADSESKVVWVISLLPQKLKKKNKKKRHVILRQFSSNLLKHLMYVFENDAYTVYF